MPDDCDILPEESFEADTSPDEEIGEETAENFNGDISESGNEEAFIEDQIDIDEEKTDLNTEIHKDTCESVGDDVSAPDDTSEPSGNPIEIDESAPLADGNEKARTEDELDNSLSKQEYAEQKNAVAEQPDEKTDEDTGENSPTASGLHGDFTNPNLFTDNQKGNYNLSENEYGKTANGNLALAEGTGKRNSAAQLAAGGKDRRYNDDGGHLIGARFDGPPGAENLDAQNRDVNRMGYKHVENGWERELKDGNKVFVNVENYTPKGSERPEATMGYAITEDKNGNRTWDAFSFQNASYSEQDEWNNLANEINPDPGEGYHNPMQDDSNFNLNSYEKAMNEGAGKQKNNAKRS